VTIAISPAGKVRVTGSHRVNRDDPIRQVLVDVQPDFATHTLGERADLEYQLVRLAGNQWLPDIDVSLADLRLVLSHKEANLDAPMARLGRHPGDTALRGAVGRRLHHHNAHRLKRHPDAKASHAELELRYLELTRSVHHLGTDLRRAIRLGGFRMHADFVPGVIGQVTGRKGDRWTICGRG
jgi:hypothetical protein